MADSRVALAWSGGKDSALALDRLVAAGHRVVALVNNVDAATGRDRAHGVPAHVVREQAARLGIPLVQLTTDWAGYGPALEDALARSRDGQGVDAFATGDIDLAEHREWNEALARKVGLQPLFPLWHEDHAGLVRAFNARGWRAVVVAVKPPLDARFLGRWLDEPGFIGDCARRGASPAGENGEYHSLVTEGPLFQRRLELTALDELPGAHGARWLDVDVRAC